MGEISKNPDLIGKVGAFGTCLPSVAGDYLESGAAKLISFWDPADAGYVMNKLAVMILEGKEISEGMDLGVPGYNNIKIDGTVIYGSAWVDVTSDNMADIQTLEDICAALGEVSSAPPAPPVTSVFPA